MLVEVIRVPQHENAEIGRVREVAGNLEAAVGAGVQRPGGAAIVKAPKGALRAGERTPQPYTQYRGTLAGV